MSAPSPLPGRGRGVARRRGFRLKPLRREGAEPEDDLAPVDAYTFPRTWRPMPLTESPDLARAAWIEKVIADPAGARRELLEAKLHYWRARLQKLQARLELAEERLTAAQAGVDEDGPAPVPRAVVWELRVTRAAAWADLEHARARLEECQAELVDA